ncbi:MAG: extracellular solute-binding protein [Blautia sp.]|nr:extracellular solute-binding protein [Blautia sp.]MDY3997630.1 extracellular solute-binding protein [Blautia sp.]
MRINNTEFAEEAGEEVTLQVFDFQAYGLDEYAEVVAAFEEEHPGVKVEVQHAANDGNTILQSRVNSGDIPDVFAVETGAAAELYYDYAYDWSDDTDVLELFHEDALEMGQYWTCDGVGAAPAVITDREVKGKLANDASKYITEGKNNGWIHTIAPYGYAEECGAYIQAYLVGDMSKEEVTQGFQDFFIS